MTTQVGSWRGRPALHAPAADLLLLKRPDDLESRSREKLLVVICDLPCNVLMQNVCPDTFSFRQQA